MDNCLGCDARCCRKFLIAPIPSDIARMERRSGKKVAEFLRLFPSRECDCRWAVPFCIRGKEYYIGLKRGKNGCLFLRRGRCSIHRFKPIVCTTFPFCIDGKKVVVSNACVRKEAWVPELEDAAKLERYHSGLARMRRLAVEWNWKRGTRGSEAELYAFLLRKEKEGRRLAAKISSLKRCR